MTIEEHGNKKIYHCYTDDNEDFNGFVFEIEVQRAN